MRTYLLLSLILILASILRLWDLSGNPPGLTWDEAALGYNAYSLLLTGKDEYGNFLPLNLKSFGDYKPALYAYLDIPFIAIFGLRELAVRLPSAIFGVLGVFGVYLLVSELFREKKLALWAAFFMAISPIHLQFSRPAFEAGMALTFNIFGVYFFLKGVEQKKYFVFSAFVFGLSILTYQASKLFVPILVVALLLIFKSRYKFSNLKIPALILSLFLLLIGWTFLNGQTNRLATVNFFAYQRSEEAVSQIVREDGLNQGDFKFQILHGQWWAYIRGLFERYLLYFSPKMLFVDGDYNQRHRVPDLGALYFFSMVLIPMGLFYFIKLGGFPVKLLLFWLLLAPIPAVLSRDLISTLRALNLILPFTILEAGGLLFLTTYLKKIGRVVSVVILIPLFLVFIFNFLIYLDRYFIHAPKEYSKYWLYGYNQMVSDLEKIQSKYEKVVVTDTWGQPYIFYLFYTKYPPQKYHQQAVLDQPLVDVGTVRKIDNIEFRHVYWPTDRGDKKSLFVGTVEELPDKDILPFKEFRILEDIDYLNGENAFRLVETL